MKLGLGNIILLWENITWDKNLSSSDKALAKTELVLAMNNIEVETDDKTAEFLLEKFKRFK